MDNKFKVEKYYYSREDINKLKDKIDPIFFLGFIFGILFLFMIISLIL